MNEEYVLSMDDVSCKCRQIAVNLGVVTEAITSDLPHRLEDEKMKAAVALNTCDRLLDMYIPILCFLQDALLDLSRGADEATRRANSQAFANLEEEHNE